MAGFARAISEKSTTKDLFHIVGRKKDLFNCGDGSNINPGTIEALLESDSFIRQAVLVGDHRSFIAALIVPERGRIAAAFDRMEMALSDREVEAALRPAGGLDQYSIGSL